MSIYVVVVVVFVFSSFIFGELINKPVHKIIIIYLTLNYWKSKATSFLTHSAKIVCIEISENRFFYIVNAYGCKQKSCPLGRSAIHLVSRVCSLGSFVRFNRLALSGPCVNSVIKLAWGSFAFLVCSVVPLFSQLSLQFLNINL